jgi:putative salt-induced outer membrane protein YdiY
MERVSASIRLQLKAIQAWDRWRLRRLAARTPGLEIDPRASSNFAAARYSLGPGARLRIEARVETERIPHALRFILGAGARVTVGEGTWLRTELGPIVLAAFEDAHIEVGPECFLNGCHLSAKAAVRLGRKAQVGPGSRVFDSDQHDLDATHPEQTAPVSLGEYAWVAADTTVMRGVSIGAHSVIGARSLVTADVPPHTLAFGIPARQRGEVGDRSRAR